MVKPPSTGAKPEKKKPDPAPPPPPPQVQEKEPEEPVDASIPPGYKQAKDAAGRSLSRYLVVHKIEPAVISEPAQEVIAFNPEEAVDVYMVNTGMHSTPFIFEVENLGPALDKIPVMMGGKASSEGGSPPPKDKKG